MSDKDIKTRISTGMGQDSGTGTAGGYFNNDKGGIPKLVFPLINLAITNKAGKYYWRIAIAEIEKLLEEYDIVVYNYSEFVMPDTLNEEQLNAIYEKANIVWQFKINPTQTRMETFEKEIEERWQNGYFFARSFYKGKGSKPTAFQPFPSEAYFIYPNKIESLEVEEIPYTPQGYSKPVSSLIITYTPPKNRKGFWGVKVYIENYGENPEIQQLGNFKYDKSQGETCTFNILLEPDANIMLENYVSGLSNGQINWDNVMTPVQRALYPSGDLNNYYISLEMQRYESMGGTWIAEDPDSRFYFDTKVGIGDTVVCTYDGSENQTYYLEGIIDKFDETYPHRKIWVKLLNTPSEYPLDATQNIDGQYVQWKVVRSSKIYVVAINEYGYHGALNNEAMTAYIAIDGVVSAPKYPYNIFCYQMENQIDIKFYYPPNPYVKQFNIYRYLSLYGEWSKIGVVEAKQNYVYDVIYPISPNAYEFIDTDMWGLAGSMYDYDSILYYAVSAVDTLGRESVIKGADRYYYLDGTWGEGGFTYRKGAGVDHGVYVVTRNTAYNLFYNSEFDWDFFYSGVSKYGKGNCEKIYYSLGNYNAQHPNVNMSWNNSALRFELNFGADQTSRDYWFKLLAQNKNIAVSGTKYANDTDELRGLGRAKIVIPQFNYYGYISGIYAWTSVSNYYLAIIPDVKNRFKASGNVSFSPAEYFISTGLGTNEADIIPCFSNATAPANKVFRNGWIIEDVETDPVIKSFSNNLIFFEPYNGYSVYQRLQKNMFFPGQHITLSFLLGRDSDFAPSGTIGTLHFTILLGSGNINDPNSGYYLKESGWSPVEIPLSSAPNKNADGTYNYSYNVMYLTIPDVDPGLGNYTWDDVTFIEFALSTMYSADDIKYRYVLTQPMLNFGIEAFPYTPDMMTELSRYAFRDHSNPSGYPPPPEDDDPMCFEINQKVMMKNGEEKRIKDIKIGDILKSLDGYNVYVKNIKKEKRKYLIFKLENNKSLKVTPEHICIIMENGKKRYAVARAINVKDLMICYDKDGYNYKKIIEISEGEGMVAKIETSFPNEFFVNGILCHNIKVGE